MPNKSTVLTVCSLCLPLLWGAATAQAGDYLLSVDGQTQEIDLNQEIEVTTAAGSQIRLKLTQKAFLNFTGKLFSMSHKNDLKPSTSDLGDNVYQTMMATPLGTGIIVQEYLDMNPEPLIDLMLSELTKEEKDYGYSYSESTVAQTVSGQQLRGKQAVTSYPGEEWTRAVYAYGGRDRGLLIVTMIESDALKAEQPIIDHFWQSLQLKMD